MQIRFVSFMFMITLLLAVLASCAGGNYGSLRLSNEVDDIFESSRVLDDHRYYYSGSDAKPNAIIGIHKDYVLKSKLWKAVDLTPAQLEQWIFFMTDQSGVSFRTYGSQILGPDGQMIGIWYSPYNQSVVRMLENRHVMIHTPTVEPVDKKKRMMIFQEFDD